MSTEINRLIHELHTGFEAFKNANNTRLKALEDQKSDPIAADQVERLNTFMNQITAKLHQENQPKKQRPFLLATETDAQAMEMKSFRDYVKTGHKKGLHALETKDFNTSDLESGGCLLPQRIHENITSVMHDLCPLMALCHSVTLDHAQGTLYEYPRMDADFEAYWKDAKGKDRWEKGLSDDDKNGSLTPKIDMQSIPLHGIYYKPRISWDLMENTGFNIIQWLETGISEYIGLLCNEAFIHGDGVKKPEGLMCEDNHSDDKEKYKIQVHKTGKNADFEDNKAYENLLHVMTSLDARYLREASWLFSSEVMKKIRLIKAPGENRYLWSPEHSASQGSSLLGYPVNVCDALHPLSKNNISMFFGNFKQGYTIVHRPNMSIVRDEFSAKPDIELLLRYAYGGAVTDGSALKALKFAND